MSAALCLLMIAFPAAGESAARATLPGRGSVGDDVPAFRVRDGYRVTLAAADLGEARFLAFDPEGNLYLSRPRSGSVLKLTDSDGDGTFDARTEFLTGQSNVHGLQWHDGHLYYTASQAGFLRKACDTVGDGVADDVTDVIPEGRQDGIPAGGGHPFRGLLVTPEAIYVTVSDPGNITPDLPDDTDRARIFAFDADGTNRRTFASGIRNTEKLQFRTDASGQVTGEIWGADHGSDWIGRPWGDRPGRQPITDLLPPDELNQYVEGGFYGHPFLVGPRIPRPEFLERPDLTDLAEKTIPPAWNYPPHAAANGFTFLSENAGRHFGADHVGDLVQAFHGSWNSSVPVGYSVHRILFDADTGRPLGEVALVQTHDGRRPLARPVDVAEAPDGTVIFSCNVTARLYRISRDD